MRVLFVHVLKTSPVQLQRISEGDYTYGEIFGHTSRVPHGVMSIQAYLKKLYPTAETSVINQNAKYSKTMSSSLPEDIPQTAKGIYENLDKFLLEDIYEEKEPDIIAFSLLFDLSVSNFELMLPFVRERFPDALIVAGGHPVNSLYEYVLNRNHAFLDACCIGEGEIPFAQLASAEDKKEYLENSPHWATYNNTRKGFPPPQKKYFCY